MNFEKDIETNSISDNLVASHYDLAHSVVKVLKEMETMYEYGKETRDIVSDFSCLSARYSNDEFSVSDFKSENIILDGISLTDNNRLKRVKNSCVYNDEFYGLAYLGLAKFTFSNYFVPRAITNGRSFDECPAISIDFWDGSRYELTRSYAEFNRHGVLLRWNGMPIKADEAVSKSINKYKELRRLAIQQKHTDLKKHLPIWLDSLRVASTKWYQSYLLSDVHVGNWQNIPEFLFDKYTQDELLKPLEDDLQHIRNHTDTLPVHVEFLTYLRSYTALFQEYEKNLAEQRTKSICEDSSFIRTSKLGLGGSFGLPGAEAIEIDMSQYEQDENGIWEYVTPKPGELMYFNALQTKSLHGSSESLAKPSQSGFITNLDISGVSLNAQIALIAVVCHTVGSWIAWMIPDRGSVDEEKASFPSETSWSARLWGNKKDPQNEAQSSLRFGI
ncbi:MAG: hypothetical protein P1U74_03770 [Legionellaceae bacterium]|nr:hypothetical protein [Legionellaceae bacterium]